MQYFITQLLVAAAWPVPYNWAQNAISDLGNTVCGMYGTRYVCSPQHDWMNASFIVLGLTMIAGSTLIYHEFHKSMASAAGFTFMAVAGFGTIVVGLFPENTIGVLHILGALLPFGLGNVALILFGLSLGLSRTLRLYTVMSGVIALIALGLFVTHHYLGLGLGAMERITAYPQTVWLVIFGLYMSRNHFRSGRSSIQSAL